MKTFACNERQLAAYLNGTLSERAEFELTQHLNECVECAGKLEKKAAGPARWQDARLLLSDADKDVKEPSGEIDQGDRLPLAVIQVLDMLGPTDEPDSLGQLGGYEVIGVVGSGAMGVVLKATDRSLDRVVALKVMNPALASCGTARQRFAREAKAAAGVLHPNVIAIHSVSTEHALPYLVMPYVKGSSLKQRLDQQGPLSITEILRIGSQVSAGLAAAHQQGLIHRDIKPSNIMLDDGVETAVITDFGLARTIDDATMTRSGTITGTPEFMSPEQARGDAIDCGSDVFSLGSVLYALATGVKPFRARTSFGVLRKITDDHPTPIREINPEIPVWFCQIVTRLHSKAPTDRPSAAEVHDLCERCLAHVYQPDRNPLPGISPATASESTPSTRPFLIGAITIMTMTTLWLVIAAMFPSAANPPESPGPNQSGLYQETSDETTIFKTMQLAFPDPERKGKLIVDINRGFVEVTGHDQSDVIIEVLNPPTTSDSASSKLETRFAPGFDLDTNHADNTIKLDTYNQSYVLNLRIKVPHETDLDLDTYYDGYLRVTRVTGSTKARSQNGNISLLDIAGSATVYGYNGNVTVGFREVAEDANLDFESYNGNIDLTLPASIEANTAILAGTGSYRTAFQIENADPAEHRSRFAKIGNNASEYQFGTINGGGIPLRIESEKGDIVIRKPE